MVRLAAKILLWLIALAALITVAVLHGPHNFAMLNSAGPINDKERRLMLDAVLLGTIVIVPVFAMAFGFAWRYREGGRGTAAYNPDVSGNRVAETIWWLVPMIIIGILSVLTWNSSHQLDPFRPLASTKSALQVQVVALDWKWLFLYPQQRVATVNYLMIPTGTPVNFTITSDAPMNSFWIPQLGGQIYAMSGMSTQLNLLADKPGNYYGSSANISGNGFSGMHFMTHAVSSATFADWANDTARGNAHLSQTAYGALAMPSSNLPPTSYASYDTKLYDTVLAKYMTTDMGHDHLGMMMGAQ